MIQNAFNTARLCIITGEIKPRAQLTHTTREAMLNGKSPAECKALVLSQAYNSIHVTTQAESDESRRKAGRTFNHI